MLGVEIEDKNVFWNSFSYLVFMTYQGCRVDVCVFLICTYLNKFITIRIVSVLASVGSMPENMSVPFHILLLRML